jgi:hypothetical protein
VLELTGHVVARVSYGIRGLAAEPVRLHAVGLDDSVSIAWAFQRKFLPCLSEKSAGNDTVVVGVELGVGHERADVLRVAEVAHRAADAIHLVHVFTPPTRRGATKVPHV